MSGPRRDEKGRFIEKREQDKMPDENNTTDSTNTRWKYTNDLLALIFILSIIVLMRWYIIDTGEVPAWLAGVFSVGGLTAIIWTFGSGAFNKASDALKSIFEALK